MRPADVYLVVEPPTEEEGADVVTDPYATLSDLITVQKGKVLAYGEGIQQPIYEGDTVWYEPTFHTVEGLRLVHEMYVLAYEKKGER